MAQGEGQAEVQDNSQISSLGQVLTSIETEDPVEFKVPCETTRWEKKWDKWERDLVWARDLGVISVDLTGGRQSSRSVRSYPRRVRRKNGQGWSPWGPKC